MSIGWAGRKPFLPCNPSLTKDTKPDGFKRTKTQR